MELSLFSVRRDPALDALQSAPRLLASRKCDLSWQRAPVRQPSSTRFDPTLISLAPFPIEPPLILPTCPQVITFCTLPGIVALK